MWHSRRIGRSWRRESELAKQRYARFAYLALKRAVMRKLLLLCSALSCGLLSAQNWALINPDYKYNYSNDGTDTISNQIFVTQVDTLGVDSFRYELNRIAVVCDTCAASLGGPCNGCFVRVDQPQFLGYECIRSGTDWFFNGVDTFFIRTNASIGSSWAYDETAGTIATVDTAWAALSFSVPDTLSRILLSTGDTLLLSRSFGILRFDKGASRLELLGVHGANVGRLFPDPLDYFNFHIGDQLTYSIKSVEIYADPGGPAFPHQVQCYWLAIITGRTDAPDSTTYTTSLAYTYPGSFAGDRPDWPMPIGQWTFNRANVISAHPILAAYPGQILDHSISWNSWYSNPYIAKSGINSNGRITMYAQPLGNSTNILFNSSAEVIPGVYPFVGNGVAFAQLKYDEDLGVRNVQYLASNLANVEIDVELVGAIIDGDTVIQPPVINWSVGMEEQAQNAFQIFPNPTSDQVVIQFEHPETSTWKILDLSGRLALKGKWASDMQDVIDVSSLQTGTYLFELTSLNGRGTRQLVIAR
jgi:hypothetical protein